MIFEIVSIKEKNFFLAVLVKKINGEIQDHHRILKLNKKEQNLNDGRFKYFLPELEKNSVKIFGNTNLFKNIINDITKHNIYWNVSCHHFERILSVNNGSGIETKFSFDFYFDNKETATWLRLKYD